MTTVLTTVSMCVTWQAYSKHQVNLFLAEHFLPCVSPLVCNMSMNVCRPLLCSKVAPCAHELLCSSALRSLVSISICSALWIAESVWEIERYGCACACAFFSLSLCSHLFDRRHDYRHASEACHLHASKSEEVSLLVDDTTADPSPHLM